MCTHCRQITTTISCIIADKTQFTMPSAAVVVLPACSLLWLATNCSIFYNTITPTVATIVVSADAIDYLLELDRLLAVTIS